MPRNLNPDRTVEVRCINNDFRVKGELMDQDNRSIYVKLPTGIELRLFKSPTIPKAYTCERAGMSFIVESIPELR